MDIQEEREAFEKKFPVPAHWIDFCGLTCKYICKYNLIDDQTLKYQDRWESWLAAKAQAVQEIDELKAQLSTEKSLRSMCEHLINTKQDEIIELKAKAQAVPGWISTSDRMPKEGEEVLVHSLGQVRQVTRDSKWAGGFKERNCYGWQAAYGQSHWMPKNIELPEEYHFYYKNDAKQKAMIEAQEPAND